MTKRSEAVIVRPHRYISRRSSSWIQIQLLTHSLTHRYYIHVLVFFSVDHAIKESHNAIFMNMGQVCTAGSRTFVQDEIYDEFVKRAVQLAKERPIGNPWESSNDSGPQVTMGYNRAL